MGAEPLDRRAPVAGDRGRPRRRRARVRPRGKAVTDPGAEAIAETAARFGWTVVSMRDDWGRVFAEPA
jgi:signal recognition particle subunit SEC65